MRFSGAEIKCSLATMNRVMALTRNPDGPPWRPLGPFKEVESVWLARSGAKLLRVGESQWRVSGYDASRWWKNNLRRDEVAAVDELKAAYHVYRAIEHLKYVDATLMTSYESKINWKGLWGVYNDGTVTPAEATLTRRG